MANEGYHEPAAKLSDETRDMPHYHVLDGRAGSG